MKVHLCKERIPVGEYSKLKKNIVPFCILRKINDNVYVIDLPNTLAIFKTFNVKSLYEYHGHESLP